MNTPLDSINEYKRHVAEIQAAYDAPVTGITSRDQIINPDALLNPNHFGHTRAGKAAYQRERERLLAIQRQQEASFKEWFDSPEQVALRERAAGLNPDLVGLDNAGSSADAGVSSSVPAADLPTDGERAAAVISSITSVVGSLASVASLASAFTTIPLTQQQAKNAKKIGEQLDLQNEMLGLQNDAQLGTMLASDITDLLGTAMQSHLDSGSTEAFDIDGFFANDSNFASLTPVYGSNPRFQSQLAKQRKAVLAHQKKAAELQSGLASSNWDLANIISDPRYSFDQKLTQVQLRPFMEACIQADQAEVTLRKTLADWNTKYQNGYDVNKAIDAANATNSSTIAQSDYNSAYYQAADGELVAAYEQFIRDCLKPSYALQQKINQGYIDLYGTDPMSEGAAKAIYLYGSNGGASWQEVYWIRNQDKFNKIVDAEIAVAQANGDTAKLKAFIGALDGIMKLNEFRTDPTIDFLHCVDKTRKRIEDAIKILESYE